ncbi:MAG TPA: hypothetical protein VK369_12680, partial [Segetibacter sp.]|nr:hypothetical protein [Segetibacter sp.]
PTDLNLLWDSIRKSLDMIKKLLEISNIKGWPKIKPLRKALRASSELHLSMYLKVKMNSRRNNM